MSIATDSPDDVTEHGYDPGFLGVRVPLPDTGGRTVRTLPYAHFTVLLDPARRLAATTAVNIDGAALVDLERGDDWHLDPRVPAEEQAGPEVYARNDLDRGHLVRRRDPVWGTPGVASRANLDTFAYPNAAPQASGFNQSGELWLGLEDHVLEHARAHRQRLTVFTGPVLQADDPGYRGVQVPLLFFKIAVWAFGGGADVRAAGFVLDQSPELDRAELERGVASAEAAGDPPPLGPFRTFQVPIRDIAELTGLEFSQLAAVDALQPVPTAAPPAGSAGAWLPLRDVDDIAL